MIKRIEIKNFQKHKDLSINLDKFNLIIGPSSSGKSSIFRALRFLFYGEWDKTFANTINEPVVIKIVLDNNIEIIREKKHLDSYPLSVAFIKNGSDVYKFEKFGNVIPQLFNIINISPIAIDNSNIEINFSNQDDKHFILSESKYIKAKFIGRLFGAHLISNTISLMSKDKKRLARDLDYIDKEIENIKSEIEKYNNLDKKKELLDKIKSLQERYDKIENIKNRIINYKEEKKELEEYVKNIKNINIFNLKLTLIKYKKITKFKEISEKINKLSNISISLSTEKIKEFKDKLSKIKELNKKNNKIKDINQNILNFENILETIIVEYNNIKEKIKSKISMCPVCKQPLSADIKDKVIEKLVKG